MPQNDGQGAWPVAVDDGQVGMAQPGHLDLDEHLARPSRAQFDFGNGHRPGLGVWAFDVHFP